MRGGIHNIRRIQGGESGLVDDIAATRSQPVVQSRTCQWHYMSPSGITDSGLRKRGIWPVTKGSEVDEFGFTIRTWFIGGTSDARGKWKQAKCK